MGWVPRWCFVLERPSYPCPENWLCCPHLVTANFITVQNKELESVIGDCHFVSATFHLFKFPKTGPTKRWLVSYNGGITGHEKSISDANFAFKIDETVEMDEETAAVLKNSQFAQDFLIRPIWEKLPTCGGCTSLAAKDTITDPPKVGYKYKVQKSPYCCWLLSQRKAAKTTADQKTITMHSVQSSHNSSYPQRGGVRGCRTGQHSYRILQKQKTSLPSLFKQK